VKQVIQGIMSKGASELEGELLAKMTWQYTQLIGQLTDSAAAIVEKAKDKDFLTEFKRLAEESMRKMVANLKGAKAGAIEDFKKTEDIAADTQADKSNQEEAKEKLKAMHMKSRNQ
jgi:isopropylmalate/homocitrate/citramalate synthase